MNSAILAALAAAIGVGAGQLLARYSEFYRWLRAERHQAIKELLSASETLIRAQSHQDSIAEATESLNTAVALVELLCPRDVSDAAAALRTVAAGSVPASSEEIRAAQGRLVVSARRMLAPRVAWRLGSDSWAPPRAS